MGMVESGSNKQSVLAKIGGNFVKFITYTAKPSNWAEIGTRGEKFVGRSLALPFNAIIYTVTLSWRNKSWGKRGSDCTNGLKHLVSSKGEDSFFDRSGISLVKFFTYLVKPSNLAKPSWGWLWHDIKNGGRYIIGMPPEEYTKFAEDVQKGITQASKNLAVKVKLVDYKKGKMIFEASRILGDASRLTSEQLDKIKKGLPNVTVDKGRNKVTIEVDVDAIIKELKREIDAQGLEVSEKQIKMLAIQRIAEEVDSTLKKFGKISGGEFKYHTDKKLLKAIGETLYRGSVSKEKPVEKSAEAVTRLEKPVQGPDPSVTETLSLSGTLIPKSNEEPSEAFRRIVQEAAKPLVGGGVSEEPPVGDGMEAARKAVAEAREKQSAQNTGIDPKDLAKLSLRTGGCGAEAAKLRERQGQTVEPQGSQGFKR